MTRLLDYPTSQNHAEASSPHNLSDFYLSRRALLTQSFYRLVGSSDETEATLIEQAEQLRNVIEGLDSIIGEVQS